MAPARRHLRSGMSLGALIAIVVALFASWSARHRAVELREPPQPTQSPVAAARSAPAPQTVPARRTDSPGFASRERLIEHFEKHGAEFPGFDVSAYLNAAQSLRDATISSEVLEATRRDGVVTRFDRRTGAFLAVNRDGTIRTYFRPNDGEQYFRRQASRAPGGGS